MSPNLNCIPQGRRQQLRAHVKNIFLGPQQGRTDKGNKADSVVRKMAACRKNDK
jgi:hypothetical protein